MGFRAAPPASVAQTWPRDLTIRLHARPATFSLNPHDHAGCPSFMTTNPPAARRTRTATIALHACLAVIASLTCWAIATRDSFDFARLRWEPRVDDVLYFARGHELAFSFADSGIRGVVQNWLAHPPHSPLLATLTALSDICSGNDLFYLYAPTMLFALLFVGTVAVIAARMRVVPAALLMLAAGTAPLLQATLTNYKPDYACGILTAIACMIACAFRGPVPGVRRLFAAGIAFGFAALAKPAALPFTLGMLSLCALVNMASADGKPFLHRFSRSIKQFGVLLGAACLVALPHFAPWGGGAAVIARSCTPLTCSPVQKPRPGAPTVHSSITRSTTSPAPAARSCWATNSGRCC